MKINLRKLIIWIPFAFLFLYMLCFQRANSHSAAPDPGQVKDPVNNQSCARVGCHSSYSAFTASRATVTIGTTLSNQVTLNGFQYSTGTQYIINFTVLGNSTKPGFEMSALTSANANAGTFAVINSVNTTLQTLGGIGYIGHKAASTNSAWSFNWTSPASNVGNITFYSGVNKSNNNLNSLGDSIFHQTYVISAAPVVLTVNAGNDATICPGTSTQLQVTASVTSGTTYAWSPTTNLTCTTCSNPIASPTSTTTYIVTATNGAQTDIDTVVVSVLSSITPAINATSNSICPGSNVTLSSSGYTSYTWSNGSTSSSTIITQANTYTLTVTNAQSCTGTNSITIQQGQTPSPTISSTQPYLCGGNSTTLSVGNFSAYHWSNNATTSTITVSQGGNYSVTVTNSSGCSASTSFNLLAYSLPTATVVASGSLTFCNGGSVTLTANSGTGYTYKWSTGANTASIDVTQSGSYKVTVYNPCDSAVSQPQNVLVNPVPDAQISPSGSLLVCAGAPQTLHASPQGLTYKWLKNGSVINGQTKDSLSVITAGNFQVVITQGGCSDTSDAVAVSTAGTGNATVDITASKNQICVGDTVTLDAGSGFTTYSWLPASSSSQTLQITNAGTYTVNVTVNNGQCTSSGSDSITISQGVNVSAPILTYDSTVCEGDTVTVSTSANTYSSYLWSTGVTTSSLTDVTGTYSVTVSETGFCGTASATIIATGTPLPDASFTNNSGVLTATTTGASYQWYYEGGTITNATNQIYTATQSGNYSLQLTVNGCSSTSSPQQIIVNGVETLNEDFSMIVYPNPVSDVLKFKLQLYNDTDLNIEVMSLDGRSMTGQKTVRFNSGENSFEEDLSALMDGIYVVYLQNENFKRTIKIIKQNP